MKMILVPEELPNLVEFLRMQQVKAEEFEFQVADIEDRLIQAKANQTRAQTYVREAAADIKNLMKHLTEEEKKNAIETFDLDDLFEVK